MIARLLGFDGQLDGEYPIKENRTWVERTIPQHPPIAEVDPEVTTGPAYNIARYRRAVVLWPDDTAGETIIVYRREW